MNCNAEAFLHQLAELERLAASSDRFVIALSGGLDSTVLTHLLATTRSQHGKSLLAVHVDHRLHPDSASWAAQCQALAAEFEIDFACEVVSVDVDAGQGTEAAARDARYTALRKHLADGDWLLSAHHQDDQAETLLLNLLRGSGPAGVAAMQSVRKIGDSWLVRPLLGVSRDELADYASSENLSWITDPSNDDCSFDRNFLRNEVMPVLASRWPHAGSSLARSAELARDSANLLMELADLDYTSIGGEDNRLPVSALSTLSTSRQKNLLRRVAQLVRLPSPAAAHLQLIVEQLLPAREDAEPLVSWPGAEARRYRDTLYLLPASVAADFECGQTLDTAAVAIGPGLGELSLVEDGGRGLSRDAVARGLTLHRRKGGEEIKPVGQTHTRKLKKLLQEEGIVPWQRDLLPLVYCGEDLVAVADLWIAADIVAENGLAIRWESRPELY